MTDSEAKQAVWAPWALFAHILGFVGREATKRGYIGNRAICGHTITKPLTYDDLSTPNPTEEKKDE